MDRYRYQEAGEIESGTRIMDSSMSCLASGTSSWRARLIVRVSKSTLKSKHSEQSSEWECDCESE